MDSVRSTSYLSDNELAKRLDFSSSPETTRRGQHSRGGGSPTKRDPLRGHYDVWGPGYRSSPSTPPRGQGKKFRRKPRMGFCGALIFLSLCLAAVILTVQFNSGKWTSITMDGR